MELNEDAVWGVGYSLENRVLPSFSRRQGTTMVCLRVSNGDPKVSSSELLLLFFLILVAANHAKFPLTPERDSLFKSDNGPMLMEGVETGMNDMFLPAAPPMPGEVGRLSDLSS